MLSGVRKYGVSLTLAHQYLDQLPESLRAAVIGTVGTIVAFRVGARDAETLAPEFPLKPDDFTGLSAHTAQVRTGDRTILLSMPPPSSEAISCGQTANHEQHSDGIL